MRDFLSEDFIRDFLDEADEHLQRIGDALLGLETTPDPDEEARLINTLMRSFHTIKGLSGMVDLQAAGELSHLMETILGRIQKRRASLEPPVIEALIQGATAIRDVIEPLRKPEMPAPDISSSRSRLLALIPPPPLSTPPPPSRGPIEPEREAPAPPPAPAPPDETGPFASLPPDVTRSLSDADRRRIEQLAARDACLSLVTFFPAPELSAAGVNVNSVREHLSNLGELLKGVPLKRGDQVGFAFVLSTPHAVEGSPMPGLAWTVLWRASPEPAPTAGEPVPATDEGGSTRRAAGSTVRVDVARLDDVMRLVGDLVVSRSRLEAGLGLLGEQQGHSRRVLAEVSTQIQRELRDLRQAVMRLRMVPLGEVFGRMPLAVRDLARIAHKQVRLLIHGEETQIDKVLVERLLDPLMHLIRNAIAHGIESPEERRAAGKDEQGRLDLSGRPEGDSIVIEVVDDGRGLDWEHIDARARELGWAAPGQSLDADRVLDVLCQPGFSTRHAADMGSGRGMGLDVVQQAICGLGGTLRVASTPGEGTRFTLRLPLTLAIIEAFIVQIGRERYAVPRDAVDAAIEIEPGDLVRHAQGELVRHRQEALPLHRLEQILGVRAVEREQSAASPPPRYGLVHSDGPRSSVLAVDRIASLREVVVRTVSDPLVTSPGVAGATDLGDGSLALILDVPGLLRARSGQAAPVARKKEVRS